MKVDAHPRAEMSSQCEPGQGAQAETGGNEGLHGGMVVRLEADLGGETSLRACREQVGTAALASGDPTPVAMVGEVRVGTGDGPVGCRSHQVHRFTQQTRT